jgi:hypothetical protein
MAHNIKKAVYPFARDIDDIMSFVVNVIKYIYFTCFYSLYLRGMCSYVVEISSITAPICKHLFGKFNKITIGTIKI